MIVFIMFLLAGCGAPEMLPKDITAQPKEENTITIPTLEEVIETPEIELENPDPEPEKFPITLEPIPLPSHEAIPLTQPSIPMPPSDSVANLVKQAKLDVEQRFSISADEIQQIEVKEVVWRDSSLGCPQEGMMYLQVLTPGYLILLHADSKDYEYHAGLGSDVIYCENPSPPYSGGLDD